MPRGTVGDRCPHHRGWAAAGARSASGRSGRPPWRLAGRGRGSVTPTCSPSTSWRISWAGPGPPGSLRRCGSGPGSCRGSASDTRRWGGGGGAGGRAYASGRAETLWTVEGELSYLDRLKAVTREEIQPAARRYLSAAHARLTLVPTDGGR